jgi:hypothetical protein
MILPLDPLPAAQIDAIVSPIVASQLERHGFVAITPRRWVRSTNAPIRDIFELSPLKGAVLSPRWGFSLDFVPHVSGRSVRWHRTAKAAVFDLCYDPVDAPAEFPGSCDISYLHGPLHAAAQATDVVARVAGAALRFWGQVPSEHDLLAAFAALKMRPTIRFGFYSYVQHPLAYAFTLARAGELEGAIKEFEAFVLRKHYPEQALPRLQQLFAEAGGAV